MNAIVRSLKGTPKCPLCSKAIRMNATVEFEGTITDGIQEKRVTNIRFFGRGVCLAGHRLRVTGNVGSAANRPGQGLWFYECQITTADPDPE